MADFNEDSQWSQNDISAYTGYIAIYFDSLSSGSGNYSGVLSINGKSQSFDQTDGSVLLTASPSTHVKLHWKITNDSGGLQRYTLRFVKNPSPIQQYTGSYGTNLTPTPSIGSGETCDIKKFVLFRGIDPEGTPTYLETLDKLDQWSSAQYIPDMRNSRNKLNL